MSPLVETAKKDSHGEPLVRRIDDKRGTFGMALFIASEATLFTVLFFTYYFVAKGNDRWKIEEPPKLHYSLPMLAILLTSSGVLYWGEQQVKKGKLRAGRLAMIGTVVLGLGFLGMTYFEFTETLLHLTPRTDAYGSIFFTTVTLHGLHVCTGILMMLWVLMLPRWEPRRRPPHRPYHNVALYWHFVDTVWVFIIILYYVAPNIYNAL
jgi:heme/copper-type cytochrome/quinol oxidase subunit 3